MTPMEAIQRLNRKIKPEWKLAFLACLVIGFFIHMPIMLSDIPNHDGLQSMYFDQNMITSGRWFLTVACGFSSYFTIPWMIGGLGLLFLALTAVVLTELLELTNKLTIVLVSGLLVAFPALASTFAYVFTLDGYMLAILLAALSVLLTKKYKLGFLYGAVCLAFSMGIYQAYLPFAIMLCIYMLLKLSMGAGGIIEKCKKGLHYLYMGILGCTLYYVILHILLRIQGKELADYQGINGMGKLSAGILENIKSCYVDFFQFTGGGNVVFNNVFSTFALILLTVCVLVRLVLLCKKRKWWKCISFFIIMVLLVIGVPVATSPMLLISPGVTYHLLMRYQWVLFLILMLDFVTNVNKEERDNGFGIWAQWGAMVAAVILLFNYAVSDQIAYSNLQKRYEKTYAYCVRLLDRIEETPGYYQGIPVAMVGVVGEEQFPVTDISQKVTSNMIGLGGDSLLYTAINYQEFMKHYLGATLNFLPTQAMSEIYYSQEYIALDSFPGANATRVVDGVLYVKTENANRD